MENIINKNLIKLELEGNYRDEVIKELALLMDKEQRLNCCDFYIEEVLKREKLSTTGIGFGIAIPHGKCKAVKIPTVAFGRKAEGIEWESLDGEKVKMVFALAVPEEAATNEHLKILALLSRKLMNEKFRQQLIEVNDEERLMELFNSIFCECN